LYYSFFLSESVFDSVVRIDFERDPFIPGIKAMFADTQKWANRQKYRASRHPGKNPHASGGISGTDRAIHMVKPRQPLS
jgi:hypothetical protein